MPLPTDVRFLPDVQRLAGILANLNPNEAFAGIPAALAAFAGGPFPYRIFPRVPGIPSWLWMDTGDKVIVSVAGVLTLADGLAVFASSLQPLVPVGAWRAGEAQVAAARAIFGNLGDRFVGAPRSWLLSGHSYGGSICCALAGLLLNAGVVADLQIASFGAPRPGDSTLRELLARYTVRRYMNSDDPVVRFPPHLAEAPALTLAAGFAAAFQWSQYVQPQGGVVLWPDGGLSYQQLPTQTLPISDVSLAAWAFSDRGFFATGHRISEYLARVTQAAALTSSGKLGALVGSSGEASQPLSPSDFQAAATGALPAVSPIGGLPMSQGFIPAQYRAKVDKVMPGDYRVMWMGVVVLSGTNRSNARSLARGINGWLRRMQGAKSADHTQFNAALAAYWLVCISSSLGFNPPLVVT